MTENIEFSKIIRILRDKYGLSQEEFAFRCDLQTSYISKIERGAHKPGLKTINKIAEALNISSNDLLAIDEMFLDTFDYDPTTFKIITIAKKLSEKQRLQLLKIAKTFLN